MGGNSCSRESEMRIIFFFDGPLIYRTEYIHEGNFYVFNGTIYYNTGEKDWLNREFWSCKEENLLRKQK